ncbi:T9SS type A sorting domain-containing protein [Bacteroidales bacterium OttesenSCG-928-J19]|nr:T9SS type A sorting domain-containing protein [Bacteroidales bacterium OttesenSCG-928-J19]
MKLKRLLLLVVACSFFYGLQAQITPTGGRLFVKPGATGTGASWSDAVDLADALAYANEENIANPGTVTEIWVAQGIYIPKYGRYGRRTDELRDDRGSGPGTGDDMRRASFAIKRPIKIYGGFAGSESAITDRTPGSNTTILDGNLSWMSGATPMTGKAYHVVYIDITTETKPATLAGDYVIDGFIIQGGAADMIRTNGADMPSYGSNPPATTHDPLAEAREGGGIFALLQRSENLLIENNIFTDNEAFYAGGGMFCQIKSPSANLNVKNNTFTNNKTIPFHVTKGATGYEYLNTAIGGGGGFCLRTADNSNKVTIEGNTFTLNEAWYRGGGAALYSDNVGIVDFIKNTITENTVTNNTITLTSTSKYDNVAGTGGGLHTYFIEDSQLTIGGSAANANTFYDNKAESQGGGLYASTSSLEGEESTTTSTPTAKTTISHNLFDSNKIAIGSVVKTVIYGGAGLYAYTYNIHRNFDTYYVSLDANNNVYKDNNAVSPDANKYNDGGGAIFSSDGRTKVTVENETFYGNKADNYAGARFYAANGTIGNFNNNTVGGANAGEPNVASGSYGGVGLLFAGYNNTFGNASNNTVTYNKAIYGYGGGVGIYVDGYAKLTFGGDANTAKNVVKYNTAPMRGGGIDVGLSDHGHATIRYNEITNNTTTLHDTEAGTDAEGNAITIPISGGGGGYIYVAAGEPTITIDDNTVTNNTSYLHGGGFCIRNDAKADLKLNRNVIEDNIATTGNGGGLDIYSNGQSKIYVQNNNKINGNQSLKTVTTENNTGGGGIYIAASATPEIHILNNEIGKTGKINTSASFGGGITLASYGSSNIYIAENSIAKNTAVKGGGGIYSLISQTSKAYIKKNSITENQSLTDGIGGGINSYVEYSAQLIIGGDDDGDMNTITNNIAAEKGAGIYVYAYADSPSNVLIKKNLIKDNNNSKKGGGIYTVLRKDSNLQIVKNTIQANAVSEDGGGIYVDGGGAHAVVSPPTPAYKTTTLIDENIIQSNSATISGGGIFVAGTTGGAPEITVLNNTITGNTTKSTGAGVAVDAIAYVDSDIKVLKNTITGNTVSSTTGGKVIKGAGVWVNAEQGKVTVEENMIKTNALTSADKSAYGAGVYCEKPTQSSGVATILVNKNEIDQNTISAGGSVNALGGGIYAALQTEDASSIVISYNKVRANKTTANGSIKNLQGGGIYTDLFTGTDRPNDNPTTRAITPTAHAITVINNLVAGNTLEGGFSGIGAGAGVFANTVKGGTTARAIYIVNNTIQANSITSTGGKAGGLGIGYTNASNYTINVHNNIIYGNTAPASSNLDIKNNGNGNVINLSYNFLGSVSGISSDATPSVNDIQLKNVVSALFLPEFVNTSGTVFTNNYNLKANSRLADYGRDIYYTAAGGDLSADIDLNLTAARKQGTSIAAGAYEAEAAAPLVIWLGKTEDWQDPNNWYPAQVPTANVTDVYIPGKKVSDITFDYVYPTLAGTQASNACDRIYFMPGAQLGRPDLLTYNKVFVEMNYGKGSLASQATLSYTNLYDIIGHTVTVATGTKGSAYDGDGADKINSTKRIQFGAGASALALDRGRWNMLSAPLKEMATGDFAFGGFPFSYIKKYDGVSGKESYIKGKWANFSNEGDLVFQPGQGFGHYYYPYKTNTPYGMDNDSQWGAAYTANGLTANTPEHIDKGGKHFGLALSNGMLYFPFYNDVTLSDTRREHQYDALNSKSCFYVYAQSPLEGGVFLQWFRGQRHEVARSANSNKFIMEGNWENYSYTVPGSYSAGDVVLIGNPFMSALDFEAFWDKNKGKIKQVYHIYQKSNIYQTYGTGGFQSSTGISQYIAPMQSFLVEVTTAGPLSLTFNASTMAKTNTGAKLKSEQGIENEFLTITASNKQGESKAWVRQLPEAYNMFCGNDFSKIIDNTTEVPEIYTMATDDEGKQRALLVNSIQNNDITIPIGMATTYSGEVTLTVDGMNKYNAKVFFIDSDKNIEKEITDTESFVYKFNNTSKEEGSDLEGRFALRFSPINNAPTEIDDIENNDNLVAVYAKDNDLIVRSSDSDLIKTVQVYNMEGHLVLEKTSIDNSFCKLTNILNRNGVYVVKVQTEQVTKSLKIIK